MGAHAAKIVSKSSVGKPHVERLTRHIRPVKVFVKGEGRVSLRETFLFAFLTFSARAGVLAAGTFTLDVPPCGSCGRGIRRCFGHLLRLER